MSKIVPFGKYKDQPVETLIADHGYREWLMAQPWFAEKFRDLYQVVINYGAEPQETPAHNRMQARFLDETVGMNLARSVYAKRFFDINEALEWVSKNESRANLKVLDAEPCSVANVQFEVTGWDVVISFKGGFRIEYEGYDARYKESFTESEYFHLPSLYVECKPLVGDDYPAVLRQIKNYKMGYGECARVLVVESFEALGATYEQVSEIFWRSGIVVILFREFDKAPWDN